MSAIVLLDKYDYDQILLLWESSVRASHYFLKEEDILFFRPLVYSAFLPSVDLYGIKSESGSLMAFMGVMGKKLEMLFVLPSCMGSGLGTSLVRYAVGRLGVDSVDVNEQNEKAVRFYTCLGFRCLARDETDGMGKPFPILHLYLHGKLKTDDR